MAAIPTTWSGVAGCVAAAGTNPEAVTLWQPCADDPRRTGQEPDGREREKAGMATDYDAPRTTVDDGGDTRTDGLEGLPAGQAALQAAVIDEDELEAADSFDLPGADLSSEEISVQILPAQADEFTCASCFLVRHRSQIALDRGGKLYCVDCEG